MLMPETDYSGVVMAKKKEGPQDEGKVFMQRLQNNLEYFRKNRPALYQMLSNMELRRAELVVTPGRNDVDMVVNGRSCYRGVAREYSLDEAEKMRQENPESRRIKTFSPPGKASYQGNNFAARLLRNIVSESPVSNRSFTGYIRGNFFPSVVFLGCGLGYHIEAITEKELITNAIILEREPEKFAISLYTVDWATICSRFSRKGHSLTFAIGKADEPVEIRNLVRKYMTRDVPFYPFFSTYFNHLADVEAARAVLENAKDLAVISANWSNYDNELMRLANTARNVRAGIAYIPNMRHETFDRPLVIVGSGPSLDKRVESLKLVRDKVVVVSAGTGLRPLLAHGVTPDYHAELDPSYLIYELLSDIDREKIRRIPLLAVDEVNPYVPTLFDNTYFYFKSDNAHPELFGRKEESFAHCNPTVTNAALAIGHSLGFRKIYLFGTDYGFESVDKDHSSKSIYGDETDSKIAEDIQQRIQSKVKKRRTFETPRVDGGTLLTRADYYSAKRSVEELIYNLKSSSVPPEIFNCADGAVIEGAEWLEEKTFVNEISKHVAEGKEPEFAAFFEAQAVELPGGMDECLERVHRELQKATTDYLRLVKTARLRGRRDLCALVNELRAEMISMNPGAGQTKITGEQLMVRQLLKGTIQHFLYVGLCHGMACEDHELVAFISTWRDGLVSFLDEVPGHFAKVMLVKRELEEDPWARRYIGSDDPEYATDASDNSEEGVS